MTEVRDIVVIGGGIAGISAAARLAPFARVSVLEAEPVPGHHSTGRSAAIFIRNYGNATLRALNAASAGFLAEPAEISESTLLTPRGELLIAANGEQDQLADYLQCSTGIEALTPEQATELVPILRKEAISGAAIERDAQDIDVDRLLQGFSRLLRANGGQIVTNARVTAISRTASQWVVSTGQDDFAAPIVINAAGGWADKVAAMAGVRCVGLRALRRSAVLIPQPDGHDIRRWPLFGSIGEGWYAKPEAGQLLVSPAEEDEVEPHDVWPEDMVLAEGLHRFEQAVTMPVTRIGRSWAGIRSFVADRTPVVGFSADAEGFFWLAGQGGYGIQTSPALSALAADLCLGRASPLGPDVVEALSPQRTILLGDVRGTCPEEGQ